MKNIWGRSVTTIFCRKSAYSIKHLSLIMPSHVILHWVGGFNLAHKYYYNSQLGSPGQSQISQNILDTLDTSPVNFSPWISYHLSLLPTISPSPLRFPGLVQAHGPRTCAAAEVSQPPPLWCHLCGELEGIPTRWGPAAPKIS